MVVVGILGLLLFEVVVGCCVFALWCWFVDECCEFEYFVLEVV